MAWKIKDFDLLLNEIPAFKNCMKELSAKKQVASQKRIYNSISQSAEEKYFSFVEDHPVLFNRVPLHMVASYLGVSRETLSRIRAKFGNK